MLGRYEISLTDVLLILANRVLRTIGGALGLPMGLEQTWRDTSETILLNVRLPRIMSAAAIGAALSTAGASYQGMFRNPLVSPDILGASTGAGFGAALGILQGFSYAGIMI